MFFNVPSIGRVTVYTSSLDPEMCDLWSSFGVGYQKCYFLQRSVTDYRRPSSFTGTKLLVTFYDLLETIEKTREYKVVNLPSQMEVGSPIRKVVIPH